MDAANGCRRGTERSVTGWLTLNRLPFAALMGNVRGAATKRAERAATGTRGGRSGSAAPAEPDQPAAGDLSAKYARSEWRSPLPWRHSILPRCAPGTTSTSSSLIFLIRNGLLSMFL